MSIRRIIFTALLVGGIFFSHAASATTDADVALSYSPDAASRQGGEPNIQVNLANAIVGGNVIHDNS